MSIRAYARHRGIKHPSVIEQIDKGHIHLTAEGKIDSDQADAEWNANVLKPSVPYRTVPRAEGDPLPASNGLDYSRARAIRENYLARLAKIEYEERSGKLVSKDEVAVAAFTKARTVRDGMLNIPDRVAAIVAAEPDADKVHLILTDEIRKALNELSGANSD